MCSSVSSIDSYSSFDQIALAQQLENHELVEFRRISAHLYKLNKRYERSLELSKKDGLWADTMETAADSKDRELAESTLYYFVESKQKECFAACLYTCYELIRPDVVLELAWRYNLMNYAMPFMIQTLRGFDDKIGELNKKLEEKVRTGCVVRVVCMHHVPFLVRHVWCAVCITDVMLSFHHVAFRIKN